MRKILAVLLFLCAASANAGTYTFTTNAADDATLQTWCFALNANFGGTLFTQPANLSGITIANAKLCIRQILNQAVQTQSSQVQTQAIVPTTLQEFN